MGKSSINGGLSTFLSSPLGEDGPGVPNSGGTRSSNAGGQAARGDGCITLYGLLCLGGLKVGSVDSLVPIIRSNGIFSRPIIRIAHFPHFRKYFCIFLFIFFNGISFQPAPSRLQDIIGMAWAGLVLNIPHYLSPMRLLALASLLAHNLKCFSQFQPIYSSVVGMFISICSDLISASA